MLTFMNKKQGPQPGIKETLKQGAVIVDVRSPLEYASGHIKGSKNIPLDTLKDHLEEIKNYNKPVITVCQSGMRSATAKSYLEGHGLVAVNGGSWLSLNNII
jgi:rhodanese-related sulfurtransferase